VINVLTFMNAYLSGKYSRFLDGGTTDADALVVDAEVAAAARQGWLQLQEYSHQEIGLP
jgi:hypothetical protein